MKDGKKMQHKVLIVDDSKLARIVMAGAFRRIRADWDLTEATDAGEALSAISGQRGHSLIDFAYARHGWIRADRECTPGPSNDAACRRFS